MWHPTFNGTQNIFMTTSWPQLAGYQYGHFCVPIVSHRIVTFGYLTQWLGEPTEGGPISVTILGAPLCKPRNAREYALKCIFYRFALAEMGGNEYFWWFRSQQKIGDNASIKHPSNETAPVPILIELVHVVQVGLVVNIWNCCLCGEPFWNEFKKPQSQLLHELK